MKRMAGTELQDVQGLGLGLVIAARPLCAQLFARPSSFGRSWQLPVGRPVRACSVVVRAGWLAWQAVASWSRSLSVFLEYRHHFKRGLVTISGNLDDEVPRGTLNSILKQSGLKEIEKDD